MKFLLTFSLIIFNLTFAFAQDDFQASLNNYFKFHKDRADDLIYNKDQIIGAEVIITGRSHSLASSFGHALLRFVYKNALSTDISIVSFVARPKEESFSTWKAATSKYSFIPEIMSHQEIWTKYYEKQNRSMTRYVLDLSPEELNQFIEVSFNYIQNPEVLNGYNFFTNNCMVAVSKILIDAGMTNSSKHAIFPNKADKWLRKNKLTTLPGINITAPDIINQK